MGARTKEAQHRADEEVFSILGNLFTNTCLKELNYGVMLPYEFEQ